jgi:SAM-dependent methyltransferase/uncharacterized protein YbaR (Trm112 family)
MRARLLAFLRCPECLGTLDLIRLSQDSLGDEEVSEGLLGCERKHWFPVVRGIPRMLRGAIGEHWDEIKHHVSDPALIDLGRGADAKTSYDRRTRANFSREWDNHDLGGRTWGMELEDRVRWFFLEPIRISCEELKGKVMLDAGCGNGSQSVAYTKLGLEVIAVDLSSGIEHGQAFSHLYPGANPANVHFVQADLQRPPLAPESVDLIHSAGVLHHTPDTLKTFRALRPVLRADGTFYVWLYKYERWVTPVVNSIRAVTTRIPSSAFARIAQIMALPFIAFCRATSALGVRQYGRLNRREAALALMDIFGAPYAHYHSIEEVTAWYRAEGFLDVWGCNDGRRGFGVCGRLAQSKQENEEIASQPALAAQ